ncbi:anti-sigma regulatory factor [Ignavibacteria bacterium]|nr:ATP-binding protein [Bacteroidota bacterium]MCZ2131886.1 ATP-binding protein [Bacteroidota bacterium]
MPSFDNNEYTARIEVSGAAESLESIRNFVRRHAERWGFSEEQAGLIALAVDEACSNIIRHSYKNDTSKSVSVAIRIEGSQFKVLIMDSGATFNPLSVSSPNMEQYFKMFRSGGLGIHIMRKVMDAISYNPAQTSAALNTLILSKKLPS